MKFSVTQKFKLWLVITLVVVVCGMIVLGVFGVNKSVDYKQSYEVTVGVDQNVDGASENVKVISEQYFKEKGIAPKSYAYQSMNRGNVHIYKFQNATKIVATELTEYVTEKLANSKVVVESTVSEVVNYADSGVWGLVIGLAVSAVAVFLYLLIMEKLASALSVLFSSVISAVLALSVISLTRIPILPILGVAVSASALLSAILSTVMVGRFKEEGKNVNKISTSEIADKSEKNSVLRFAFVFFALLLVSIILGTVGGLGYLTFVALTLLVVDVCAVFSSFVWTPIFWSALKKK